MKTGYLLNWIAEQGEEIFSTLADKTCIARVEVDKVDINVGPLFEIISIEEYARKAGRFKRIKLAVAVDLAGRALEVVG
jgi:hypothetical protein